MKIGDKVRFLSEVGGGIVRGFKGKDTVLVEDEDGFDIPMLIRECVVIDTNDYNMKQQPSPIATHTKSAGSPNQDGNQGGSRPTLPQRIQEEREIRFRPADIRGRDKLALYLGFVPHNVKTLSDGKFDAYLVNDSNYYLNYQYLSGEGDNWYIRCQGTVSPNSKEFLEEFNQSMLNDLEQVAVQCTAYKEGKGFALQPAISAQVRLHTVKFYKLHSFQKSIYFESPALVYDVLKQQAESKALVVTTDEVKEALLTKEGAQKRSNQSISQMKGGILEIDLHAHELLDSTLGMSNGAILEYQLDYFRKVLDEHQNKRGQRIVFIHGKGDGVLRKKLLEELKANYKRHQVQDASFQEYGFGASMVIIK
ncbi:MAG: DUF2027 domain-containing protein [Phocaeicola sp.]